MLLKLFYTKSSKQTPCKFTAAFHLWNRTLNSDVITWLQLHSVSPLIRAPNNKPSTSQFYRGLCKRVLELVSWASWIFKCQEDTHTHTHTHTRTVMAAQLQEDRKWCGLHRCYYPSFQLRCTPNVDLMEKDTTGGEIKHALIQQHVPHALQIILMTVITKAHSSLCLGK